MGIEQGNARLHTEAGEKQSLGRHVAEETFVGSLALGRTQKTENGALLPAADQ